MTRDLNRFKKKNKKEYKILLNDIQEGHTETELLEYTFPLIHGANISSAKEYNFRNIIEARAYLNDKELSSNVIEICKYLLKSGKEDIKEILGDINSKKLKKSLTLFDYITNPNIDSLLTFRKYDKNLIKKIFTENKEFSIFKKIINKYFDGELDKETLLIIESETLEYSLKESTLKNINKKAINESEDLLIKYSEICPLVISAYDKSTKKQKIKNFYKSLTDKEYILFLEFNINNSFKKSARINKHNIKEKMIAFTFLGLTLLIGTSIVPIKKSLSTENLISQISIDMMKDQNAASLSEDKEEIEEQILIEAEPVIEKEPEPIITNYPYVTPTGSGNRRIVEIAASQIGNVGGYPYWSWYGFSSRVNWCGCFVSWVANEAGLLGTAIPRFSIASDGLNWFIRNKLFRDRNYIPRSGDLIFFDYNYDGSIEHVGIVDRVEGGRVYTIEGNTRGDSCRQNSFAIGHGSIYGYGTPNY